MNFMPGARHDQFVSATIKVIHNTQNVRFLRKLSAFAVQTFENPIDFYGWNHR